MPHVLTARIGRPGWGAFYGVILAAWALLFALQAAVPTDATPYGSAFWQALCIVAPGAAGWPAAFAMWALMVAAMMAPGFVPALRTYDDLTRGAGFWPLAAGFGVVWLGFAAAAAALQGVLAGQGLVSPDGRSTSALLSAALLIAAGTYQFSPLKDACLSRCRAPFAFFLANWRDGPAGGLRMGAQMGRDCLGCCWALMALAFVGGTMNLAFMGLATLLMTLEKLPHLGRPITRPLGALLILSGAFLAGTAI